MEIGKQIKKYRLEMEVSQEELAERIFVSRQTVSNWENDKNYPDLKSLLLLSSLFGVSLDILVKGDIKQMKEEIKTEDTKYVKRIYRIYSILSFSLMALVFPLLVLPLWIGTSPIHLYLSWGITVLLGFTFIFFFYRFRKIRKKFDVKTYKEIVAFCEGKTLSEVDKQRAREEPYASEDLHLFKNKKLNYAFAILFIALIFISIGIVFFTIFA